MRILDLPCKLNPRYTCQGVDASGIAVTFDDLLNEGDLVATAVTGEGDNQTEYGPYGEVVRRNGELWIEEIPDAVDY
jgi:hypothetical protein